MSSVEDKGNLSIEDIGSDIEVKRLRNIGFKNYKTGVSGVEIISLIKPYLSEVSSYIESIDIDRVVQLYKDVYSDLDNFPDYLHERMKMFLRPVTELDVYKLPNYLNLFESFKDSLFVGFDVSSHSPRSHAEPSYLVVNIGFYIWGVGRKDFYISDYIPYFVLIKNYDIDLRLIEKFVELDFIKLFADYLVKLRDENGFNDVYLFFDESFNMGYTYSFAIDVRKTYLDAYRKMFNYLSSKDILYAGVFYTGASHISKLFKELNLYDQEVRDRLIMNSYLDEGTHSQVFKVYSGVLSKEGIDVYATYLKIEDYNILRIEFTEQVFQNRRYLNLIRSVYLDSFKGKGYPYSLSKAHDTCVLRFNIRSEIETEIGRRLFGSQVKGISRKSLRKRRRVV